MVEQPCQVAIGILLLVEPLELDGDIFDLLGERAGGLLLVGPVAVGEHLCAEVDTGLGYLFGLLGVLELVYKIFGKIDIIKHGC